VPIVLMVQDGSGRRRTGAVPTSSASSHRSQPIGSRGSGFREVCHASQAPLRVVVADHNEQAKQICVGRPLHRALARHSLLPLLAESKADVSYMTSGAVVSPTLVHDRVLIESIDAPLWQALFQAFGYQEALAANDLTPTAIASAIGSDRAPRELLEAIQSVHDLGNDGDARALFDVAAEQGINLADQTRLTANSRCRSRYHACTRIEGLCSCCPPGAGDGLRAACT